MHGDTAYMAKSKALTWPVQLQGGQYGPCSGEAYNDVICTAVMGGDMAHAAAMRMAMLCSCKGDDVAFAVVRHVTTGCVWL
jgi:hypothetical protein